MGGDVGMVEGVPKAGAISFSVGQVLKDCWNGAGLCVLGHPDQGREDSAVREDDFFILVDAYWELRSRHFGL